MSYKEARIKAGKRVVEVAEHMGCHRITVYQWEEGVTNPAVSKLPALAKFYGCTVDELLQGNPIRNGVQ